MGKWVGDSRYPTVGKLKMRKKYYVYELIDPRNNIPFYIGKGSGDRIYYHIRCVKRGITSCNYYKESVINEIFDAGLDIIHKKIYESYDEKKCYEKEMRVINKIGLKNLTNIQKGGICIPERRGGGHKIFSDTHRKNISNSLVGRIHSKEHRRKISLSMGGSGILKEDLECVKIKRKENKYVKIKRKENKLEFELTEKLCNINEIKKDEMNGMFGKKHTDDTKLKQHKANSGKKNPMYGKDPWNKGMSKVEMLKFRLNKMGDKLNASMETSSSIWK